MGEPPAVRAVRFPAGYGAPGGPESFLPWSYVDKRLAVAPNYWITTVGPDARPHARPVDGVWVDGALCFGGSPETRWVRNLMANPSVSVHLSSEAEAIILEGTAQLVTDPSHALAAPCAAASKEKYPQYYSDNDAPFRPFWALRPMTVFAWTLAGFPRDATRWRFNDRRLPRDRKRIAPGEPCEAVGRKEPQLVASRGQAGGHRNRA